MPCVGDCPNDQKKLTKKKKKKIKKMIEQNTICPVCSSPTKGFCFGHKESLVFFCSMKCQKEWREQSNDGENMDYFKKKEQAAMEKTIKDLGELVGYMGMDRPMSDYSKEEILDLIDRVVHSFQKHMKFDQGEAPF